MTHILTEYYLHALQESMLRVNGSKVQVRDFSVIAPDDEDIRTEANSVSEQKVVVNAARQAPLTF